MENKATQKKLDNFTMNKLSRSLHRKSRRASFIKRAIGIGLIAVSLGAAVISVSKKKPRLTKTTLKSIRNFLSTSIDSFDELCTLAKPGIIQKLPLSSEAKKQAAEFLKIARMGIKIIQEYKDVKKNSTKQFLLGAMIGSTIGAISTAAVKTKKGISLQKSALKKLHEFERYMKGLFQKNKERFNVLGAKAKKTASRALAKTSKTVRKRSKSLKLTARKRA